jgi:5'-methylthioadenosine phosphorylase
MPARVLGVIGGSGLYEMAGLSDVEEVEIDTPFGAPSDKIVRGRIGDVTLLFLPRHGRGHRLAPHLINYRANVCAMKRLGATQLVSLSAVGSMRENIEPGHVVIVDQYLDMTRRRTSTFFDDGVVAHVAFADPVCADLARAAALAASRAGAIVHQGGTYVCIDGPQFSTRAESHLYRGFGVAVIGMTAMPEAKLAREAELPYATIAFSTDYDAWHETVAAVSVEAVLTILRRNVDLAKRIVAELANVLPDPAKSPATHALRDSIITDKKAITSEAMERLGWLIGAYLKER